jgi:membrane-bound lytic murein transglycosylase D
MMLPARLLLLTALLLPASPPAPAAEAPALADAIPEDSRLRRNMEFWLSIYTQYDTTQGVVHDSKYVDIVYEVLPRTGGGRIRAAKDHWREVLFSLHRKEQGKLPLTDEEKSVAEKFSGVDEPAKYLRAAHRKRLRFQLGQKDRFRDGLRYSGRYLKSMEEIFRKAGLPRELTRLPFVESSFNIRARSKVGASGVWQFMRSTAQLFIRVDDAVDERNDPIRATEAAAQLLKLNFESLRTWPLAVTAYNHGRKSLMRAVRRVGTDDLGEIVANYRGRTFGFASSNFFPSLVAAVVAERDADKYFGPVEKDEPLEYVEAELPDFVGARVLERFLKLDGKKLRELNPALLESVFKGEKLIPAGYRLRIPLVPKLGKEASLRVFEAGYEQIPAFFKTRRQKRDRS